MSKNIKAQILVSLMIFSGGVWAKKSNPQRKPASAKVVAVDGIEYVLTDSKDYRDKIDFATLEAKYPLKIESIKNLDPDKLKKLKGEQLDQLYARLRSGPIPDGGYNGTIIFTEDGGMEGIANHILGTSGLGKEAMALAFHGLKTFGEHMWEGKHFYKTEKVLRNYISNGVVDDFILKGIAKGILGTSPDVSKFRKGKLGKEDYYELFPAKLYCGQSLMDSRRESVIIDYAYSRTIDGYDETVDVLADGQALSVRDEIRMIRPGFYLGRAYLQKAFGLYFTLYNKEVAEKETNNSESWKAECFSEAPLKR